MDGSFRAWARQGVEMFDLKKLRDGIVPATSLFTHVAQAAGGEVIARRPGRVIVRFPDGTIVEATIRRINPFVLERRAYEAFRRPVPARVLEDLLRWNREHLGSDE